jgi:hypothetical protein
VTGAHLAAVAAAVRFYDLRREDASERHARVQAELYLRRKVEDLNANEAAELLADALATRATARESTREDGCPCARCSP